MYSVETDRSKRLVVIGAAGHVTKEEVKEVVRQVRQVLEDVTPGFRALTDFRWLESMDASAAEHIAEIMEALAQKGVRSVVRVVPDQSKDIGLNILSMFHYGPHIEIVTVERMADALQLLAESSES